MRQSWIWVGLALISMGGELYAQQPVGQPPARPQTTLLLPAGPLLPEKFGSWQRAGNADEQSNVGAGSLPGAKIFAEDGATRSSTANYQLANGGQILRIDAIEFMDATGAYSAFTWWASRQQRSSIVKTAGEQAVLAGQGLLFRAGTVLVMVHDPAQQLPNGGQIVLLHEPATQKQVIEQLSAVLPKVTGPKGQPPLLPTLLPSRGLAAGSVRYSLGTEGFTEMDGLLPAEIVGFDKAAEIVTANYTARGAHATLTLFLYPTPQIAGEKGRAIEAAVNANPGKFGETIKMRRDGTLIAFAAGDLSATAADALVKAANLHEEMTWNHAILPQVDFNVEIHKTATLLENIAVFSGVGALAAILLGLFLGFGRAGIRVMMGKPAAAEQEFLAINLRGIPPGRLDPTHPEGLQQTPLEPPPATPQS